MICRDLCCLTHRRSLPLPLPLPCCSIHGLVAEPLGLRRPILWSQVPQSGNGALELDRAADRPALCMRRSGPCVVTIVAPQLAAEIRYCVVPRASLSPGFGTSCGLDSGCIRADGQAAQYATALAVWVNGSFSNASSSPVQTNFVRSDLGVAADSVVEHTARSLTRGWA